GRVHLLHGVQRAHRADGTDRGRVVLAAGQRAANCAHADRDGDRGREGRARTLVLHAPLAQPAADVARRVRVAFVAGDHDGAGVGRLLEPALDLTGFAMLRRSVKRYTLLRSVAKRLDGRHFAGADDALAGFLRVPGEVREDAVRP